MVTFDGQDGPAKLLRLLSLSKIKKSTYYICIHIYKLRKKTPFIYINFCFLLYLLNTPAAAINQILFVKPSPCQQQVGGTGQ